MPPTIARSLPPSLARVPVSALGGGRLPWDGEDGGPSPLASPLGLPGLHSWWHADEDVTLDPTYVSDWADQSGNGNDLTQSVAGNRPIPTTLTVSGKAAIYFDPARFDFLDRAAISAVSSTTTAVTFFAAVEIGLTSGWREIISWSSGLARMLRVRNTNKAAMWAGFEPEVSTSDNVAGALVRYIGTFSGGASGTCLIRRQYSETATQTAAASALSSTTPRCRVGGRDGTFGTTGMKIRTLGAYARELSESEQFLLDRYLQGQL